MTTDSEIDKYVIRRNWRLSEIMSQPKLEANGFTEAAANAVAHSPNLRSLISDINDIKNGMEDSPKKTALKTVGDNMLRQINADPNRAKVLNDALSADGGLTKSSLGLARTDPAALGRSLDTILGITSGPDIAAVTGQSQVVSQDTGQKEEDISVAQTDATYVAPTPVDSSLEGPLVPDFLAGPVVDTQTGEDVTEDVELPANPAVQSNSPTPVPAPPIAGVKEFTDIIDKDNTGLRDLLGGSGTESDILAKLDGLAEADRAFFTKFNKLHDAEGFKKFIKTVGDIDGLGDGIGEMSAENMANLIAGLHDRVEDEPKYLENLAKFMDDHKGVGTGWTDGFISDPVGFLEKFDNISHMQLLMLEVSGMLEVANGFINGLPPGPLRDFAESAMGFIQDMFGGLLGGLFDDYDSSDFTSISSGDGSNLDVVIGATGGDPGEVVRLDSDGNKIPAAPQVTVIDPSGQPAQDQGPNQEPGGPGPGDQ